MIVSGIKVEVVRKKIKNMHLYVLPPDAFVRVTAPVYVSDSMIELFVLSRYSWILQQQKAISEQARMSKREYITGEAFYVFGRQYYLVVKYSPKEYSLDFVADKAIFTVREGSTVEQRENYINEWYRDLLKQELSKVIVRWEKRTGLHAEQWVIKNMRTQWGSCLISKKKITINLQLAKKTHESLDYVVLHELTHLVSEKHGEIFVAHMDKYMPFWRDIRKSLNSQILDYVPDTVR